LAANRFVISTFSRYAPQYAVFVIDSSLSHVGRGIIVDTVITTI